MFKSRTSLVYTFWVEEIFEFYPSLFIPAMYMGLLKTVCMKTNTSRGTYVGCRLDLVCQRNPSP